MKPVPENQKGITCCCRILADTTFYCSRSIGRCWWSLKTKLIICIQSLEKHTHIASLLIDVNHSSPLWGIFHPNQCWTFYCYRCNMLTSITAIIRTFTENAGQVVLNFVIHAHLPVDLAMDFQDRGHSGVMGWRRSGLLELEPFRNPILMEEEGSLRVSDLLYQGRGLGCCVRRRGRGVFWPRCSPATVLWGIGVLHRGVAGIVGNIQIFIYRWLLLMW